MPDEQGFIAAIAEAPDDDALRLIFADWLEEKGDAVRAEFIRVQCELARLNPADERYPELHVRQLEILAEHERNWLGEWSERLVRWEFRRGLLHAVTITPEPFVAHGSDLVSRHPVERVAFVNQEGESLAAEDLRQVVAAPAMAAVRAVEASGCRADEPMWGMYGGEVRTNVWLEALAGAKHATRIEELNLNGGTRVGRDAIDLYVWEIFCRAPHLRNLRQLDFRGRTYITEDRDTQERILPRRERSQYQAAYIADRDTRERILSCLAASPLADGLRILFDPPSVESPTRERVHLALVSGPQALTQWPGLSTVTELAFTNYHDLADHGGLHLFRSPFLSCRLERLDLAGNLPTLEGVQALAECPVLKGLRWLGFGCNHLTPEKMVLLLDSPHLRHLEALHLLSEFDRGPEQVGASEAALILLAESGGFPRLRDVVVGSRTPQGAIDALRKRFGPRLRICYDY